MLELGQRCGAGWGAQHAPEAPCPLDLLPFVLLPELRGCSMLPVPAGCRGGAERCRPLCHGASAPWRTPGTASGLPTAPVWCRQGSAPGPFSLGAGGWPVPGAPAQAVPVVFQHGRCARCPGALGRPRVSTELLVAAAGTSRTRYFSFCLAVLGPALWQKRACSPCPCADALPCRCVKASWDLLPPAGLADARPGGRDAHGQGSSPSLGGITRSLAASLRRLLPPPGCPLPHGVAASEGPGSGLGPGGSGSVLSWDRRGWFGDGGVRAGL